MPNANRRIRTLEFDTIENALQMVKTNGIGPAIDYMLQKQIPASLAFRVLSDPAYQRHLSERRAACRWTMEPGAYTDEQPI